MPAPVRRPSDAYTPPSGITFAVRGDWRRVEFLARRTGRVVPDEGHILDLAAKRVEQALDKPEASVFDAACPSCGRVTRWRETVREGQAAFAVLCDCEATG